MFLRVNKRTGAIGGLTLLATALALLVAALGAYTRLVDAGLGCPDWPGCYGFLLVPDTAQEIIQAEALFPDAPFEAGKAWTEVIHRIFAGILGLLILAISILAWRHRDRPGQPLKLPLLLLALVAAQALFGMWTVTLKLWPQVVTVHLLGGFATLSLLWLLALRLEHSPWELANVPRGQRQRLKIWAAAALALLVAQITLGGWTSANYAALACPDFPTCQNRWWPPMNFASGFNVAQEIGPNYLGGQLDGEARVAIHFAHRLGALLLTLVLGLLIAKLYRVGGDQRLRSLTHVLLALLLLQLGLGVSNVVWMLPLWIALAHNVCAALLLLALVSLVYRLGGQPVSQQIRE